MKILIFSILISLIQNIDINDYLSFYESITEVDSSVIYQKEILQETSGLHRKIKYNVILSLGPRQIRNEMMQENKCFMYLMDFCDKGFYIDREEL